MTSLSFGMPSHLMVIGMGKSCNSCEWAWVHWFNVYFCLFVVIDRSMRVKPKRQLQKYRHLMHKTPLSLFIRRRTKKKHLLGWEYVGEYICLDHGVTMQFALFCTQISFALSNVHFNSPLASPFRLSITEPLMVHHCSNNSRMLQFQLPVRSTRMPYRLSSCLCFIWFANVLQSYHYW